MTNTLFETKFLEFAKARNATYECGLAELSRQTVGIDADVLLRLAASKANPIKSLQEGHSAVDIDLQRELERIIKTLS
jgi:hypothetical protein